MQPCSPNGAHLQVHSERLDNSRSHYRQIFRRVRTNSSLNSRGMARAHCSCCGLRLKTESARRLVKVLDEEAAACVGERDEAGKARELEIHVSDAKHKKEKSEGEGHQCRSATRGPCPAAARS